MNSIKNNSLVTPNVTQVTTEVTGTLTDNAGFSSDDFLSSNFSDLKYEVDSNHSTSPVVNEGAAASIRTLSSLQTHTTSIVDTVPEVTIIRGGIEATIGQFKQITSLRDAIVCKNITSSNKNMHNLRIFDINPQKLHRMVDVDAYADVNFDVPYDDTVDITNSSLVQHHDYFYNSAHLCRGDLRVDKYQELMNDKCEHVYVTTTYCNDSLVHALKETSHRTKKLNIPSSLILTILTIIFASNLPIGSAMSLNEYLGIYKTYWSEILIGYLIGMFIVLLTYKTYSFVVNVINNGNVLFNMINIQTTLMTNLQNQIHLLAVAPPHHHHHHPNALHAAAIIAVICLVSNIPTSSALTFDNWNTPLIYTTFYSVSWIVSIVFFHLSSLYYILLTISSGVYIIYNYFSWFKHMYRVITITLTVFNTMRSVGSNIKEKTEHVVENVKDAMTDASIWSLKHWLTLAKTLSLIIMIKKLKQYIVRLYYASKNVYQAGTNIHNIPQVPWIALSVIAACPGFDSRMVYTLLTNIHTVLSIITPLQYDATIELSAKLCQWYNPQFAENEALTKLKIRYNEIFTMAEHPIFSTDISVVQYQGMHEANTLVSYLLHVPEAHKLLVQQSYDTIMQTIKVEKVTTDTKFDIAIHYMFLFTSVLLLSGYVYSYYLDSTYNSRPRRLWAEMHSKESCQHNQKLCERCIKLGHSCTKESPPKEYQDNDGPADEEEYHTSNNNRASRAMNSNDNDIGSKYETPDARSGDQGDSVQTAIRGVENALDRPGGYYEPNQRRVRKNMRKQANYQFAMEMMKIKDQLPQFTVDTLNQWITDDSMFTRLLEFVDYINKIYLLDGNELSIRDYMNLFLLYNCQQLPKSVYVNDKLHYITIKESAKGEQIAPVSTVGIKAYFDKDKNQIGCSCTMANYNVMPGHVADALRDINGPQALEGWTFIPFTDEEKTPYLITDNGFWIIPTTVSTPTVDATAEQYVNRPISVIQPMFTPGCYNVSLGKLASSNVIPQEERNYLIPYTSLTVPGFSGAPICFGRHMIAMHMGRIGDYGVGLKAKFILTKINLFYSKNSISRSAAVSAAV